MYNPSSKFFEIKINGFRIDLKLFILTKVWSFSRIRRTKLIVKRCKNSIILNLTWNIRYVMLNKWIILSNDWVMNEWWGNKWMITWNNFDYKW